MKALTLVVIFLCCSFTISYAQRDANTDETKWMKGWTEFAPNQEEYPEIEETLPNLITSTTYLSNDTVYLLSGDVYVANGASLIIEEGTIIRGDVKKKGSLIITKGAQIIAQGTKKNPILFTSNNPSKSRKPGDWGGIIIAGGGKINSPSGTGIMEGNFYPQFAIYGGDDDSKDTATSMLSFVRIEYAGKKTNDNKKMNGLTLYALSEHTVIDHIMISYAADDSFQCYGGSVPMNHLISYKAQDDDFDFSQGYHGKLETVMAIRHPYVTDASGSYSIEIDGYHSNEGLSIPEERTQVTVKNATFINLTTRVNYKHTGAAIALNKWGKLTLTDSKVSGYSNVIKLDQSFQSFQDIKSAFSLENSIFNIHDQNIVTTTDIHTDLLNTIVQYNMFTNTFQNATEFFTAPLHKRYPVFTLKQENFDSSTVMQ